MRKIIAVTILAAMPVLLHAAGQNEPQQIFESRCSICHPTDWALEKRKSREGWAETVARMRGKTAGNAISDHDARQIIEYLTAIRGR